LRIDSPGGSVAPTQEIYEKVKTLRGVKPVIASVGAVAASGGYYAALECEKIVANRGSIIGSIGVILEYPVAVDLLEKIGLRFETVKSGEVKDMGNPTREVTERDREIFQSVIYDLHRQFLDAVVEGRSLEKSMVEPLADGSVFTGEQALNLGLVDTLGTLENAIEIAAYFAEITFGLPVISAKYAAISMAFSNVPNVSTNPRFRACSPVKTLPSARGSTILFSSDLPSTTASKNCRCKS
jgi:protease-4